MANSKIYTPQEGALFKKLDLHTLGRPFHRLEPWADLLRSDLNTYFDAKFNQRYQASYRIKGVSLHGHAPSEAYWQTYEMEDMQIAVSFDPSFVLSLLEYRYGKRDASIKPTETELRFARRLGESIAGITATRIMGQSTPVFSPHRQTASRPCLDSFTMGVRLNENKEEEARETDSFWIALDRSTLSRLLDIYTLRSSIPSARPLRNRVSLDSHLHFSLRACLCDQTMTLDHLLRLRVGDIVPTHIKPRADVIIGETPLFSAAIAEHRGKLCLSSFQHLE